MRARLGKRKENKSEFITITPNVSIEILTSNIQSINRLIPKSHHQMRRGDKSQKIATSVLKSNASKHLNRDKDCLSIKKAKLRRKLNVENLGIATKGVIDAIQKWNKMDLIDEIIVFGLTNSMVLPYKDIPRIFIKVKEGADEGELFADMMEENYGNINMGPAEIIFNTAEYEDYNLIKRGVKVNESFFDNVISN